MVYSCRYVEYDGQMLALGEAGTLKAMVLELRERRQYLPT
jgi:hypothetical protein